MTCVTCDSCQVTHMCCMLQTTCHVLMCFSVCNLKVSADVAILLLQPGTLSYWMCKFLLLLLLFLKPFPEFHLLSKHLVCVVGGGGAGGVCFGS